MHAFAAAGAAFLIAVLWFDLMFDVQTRRYAGATLPAETLTSISAYYRRATIEATPMNRLVSAVMLLTISVIILEIARRANPWWVGWVSLAASTSAIGLALSRTVPYAVRLGRAKDQLDMQSHLARTIYRDHLYCLAAMSVVLVLQLSDQF